MATQGFYFYLEFVMAFLLLAVLILAVPTSSVIKTKEVVFMDMSQEAFETLMSTSVEAAEREKMAPTDFKLKPITILYTDSSGNQVEKVYTDTKTISVTTYNYYDSETGENTKIEYFPDSFDDMLRLSYTKRYYGSIMSYGDDGMPIYETFLRGNETDRFITLLSALHSDIDIYDIVDEMDQISVRYTAEKEILNNRQNFIPIVVTFMCTLMSVFVLVSYIAIDKAEGQIKAFSVAPVKMHQYLISKMLVVMTTTVVSSLIIIVPIMGLQPNYLALLILIIVLSILGSSIALVVGSYFKDMVDGFGTIFVVVLALMLPIISYLMPAFSPTWMKFVPSYYMLEASKEALLKNGDIGFVMMSSLGMLAVSLILFFWANNRFKKTLTI